MQRHSDRTPAAETTPASHFTAAAGLDGEAYEARSADLLTTYGFTVIARRYRCRAGEIDLIAVNAHQLLLVEVRARRSRSHGGAAASVDRKKQCKLMRCAAFFLRRNPQWQHLPCRFDVVAWEPGNRAGVLTARWIPGAFLA
jgi:putative endonuclease